MTLCSSIADRERHGVLRQIIVDPIEIWTTDSSSSDDAWSDIQRLATDFHQTLTERLARSYRIVETSQSGAMRIRIAMVDARPAACSVQGREGRLRLTPVSPLLTPAWTFITGKPTFGAKSRSNT